jgi:Tfp pilus assembly protein PilN
MRAVNLLPRDVERTRTEGARMPLLVAAGGVAAVTVFAVFLSFSASGAANDRRAELAAVDAQIALAPSHGTPQVTQAALVEERTNRVAALASALSTRVPFDRLLRELALVLPDDAWLTGITASAPVGTTPAGSTRAASVPASTPTAQGVTILGATYSQQSVARVLGRLGAIPALENVQLTSSTRVEPQADPTKQQRARKNQKAIVAFTIAATLSTGSSS